MDQSQESIENEIRRNEQRIASLTEQLRTSLQGKDNRIKGLQVEIESLKKEIEDLKHKNEILDEQLQAVKGDNQILKGDNQILKERIEVLEERKRYEDSVLIIGGIVSTTQRNMCNYVLGDHFKSSWHYKFKDIDEYIEEDLQHANDQDEARQRLEELKKTIPWNPRLVGSLKDLNCSRINIAHPELTSEKILQATEFLIEKRVLNEEVVENIKKLKKQWETSEALLQKSSARPGQDPDGPRNLSSGQNQGTSTSKTAVNRYISTCTIGQA